METIKVYSLSKHSQIFSVADEDRDYLFIHAENYPKLEEPYRADSYGVGHLKKGSVLLNAGLAVYEINAPAMITLGPSVIRSFSKKSEDVWMDIILFKDSFLLKNFADPLFLNRCDFFDHADRFVQQLQLSEAIKFDKIFDLIQLTQDTAHYLKADMIKSYLFALIYEVESLHFQNKKAGQVIPSGFPMFEKFKQLLSRHYMKERKLEFYARELFVTPKTLSAVIRKQTGRSAGKWIDDTIILEAKVLLQNRSFTIEQISGMLNFSNQSVFGKFFKTGTGLSPMAYRKKVHL